MLDVERVRDGTDRRPTATGVVRGYHRGLRLDGAARQLSGTAKPLADVAAGAGFYDQSHFTRAFKARFRMTPGAFRAAARGGGDPSPLG